jgi:hypothetical protein
MGKQANVIKLWDRINRETKHDLEELPAEKIGERPLGGLCCKTCSLTRRFPKLEVPRIGKKCRHTVFQENVILCARCALNAEDGPLCRSCGMGISDLLDESRAAAKAHAARTSGKTKPRK